MTPILELEKLNKSFGAIKVADDLSYSLMKGEALGIIGPNGAGKTSMFNLITGALSPDSGIVRYLGKNITNYSPPLRCRAGIARSFQVPQPFGGMTVFENTLVASKHGANLNEERAQNLCVEVLEQTGLINKANLLAAQLTLLERKRLELARALCCKPKLLLLDEIAGGLTEGECNLLVKTIKKINNNGISIIWIEHIVHALLAVVDRLIVINFGHKVADGEPTKTMATRNVQEIYLGIEIDG